MKLTKCASVAAIVAAIAALASIPVMIYTSEIKEAINNFISTLNLNVNLTEWDLVLGSMALSTLAGVVLYLLDLRRKSTRLSSTMNSIEKTSTKLHEIRFDYLPISPLDRGWQWSYGDNSKKPSFSPSVVSPIPGCLTVVSTSIYCIENQIEENISNLCKRVKVAAKLRAEGDTMFWTGVELANRDNSKWTTVCIKYYKGNKPSEKHPQCSDEWVLWMPGTELENDWTQFDIYLPEAVQNTWGKEGWVFKSLKSVSIRGNISISPIEFYRDDN